MCEARLFFRGERAPRVAVLLHGITSCPRQFDSLAKRLFENGYAVLAPRFAHHGLQDRLTTAQERLTAEEIVAATNEAIDIARGLGDSVTVVGLSMGGVAAAFAAEMRSDVSKVVVIAPILVSKLLPANDLLQKATANLLLTLPNQFVWWNDAERENLKGPKATYPRFSSKAMGETLRLGVAVMEQAKSAAPKAQQVVIVLNENDAAINNEACRELAKRWEKMDMLD